MNTFFLDRISIGYRFNCGLESLIIQHINNSQLSFQKLILNYKIHFNIYGYFATNYTFVSLSPPNNCEPVVNTSAIAFSGDLNRVCNLFVVST